MTLLFKTKALANVFKGNKKQNLRKNQKGATAIEYALLLAMVGIVIIVGLSQLGGSTNNILQEATDVFDDASPTS